MSVDGWNGLFLLLTPPPPPPDNCSGNGLCANQTCSWYAQNNKQPPEVNGQAACLQTTNSTSATDEGNATEATTAPAYCLCQHGYMGANCLGQSSSLGTALAISGGIIALIVICGVILAAVLLFGAKKGVDWVSMQQQLHTDFSTSPIHVQRDQEFSNPLHS